MSERKIYSEEGGQMVSTAGLQDERFDVPPPDLPGENKQSVRCGVAHRIGEIVDQLNQVLQDAHTAGLRVTISGPSLMDWRQVPKVRIHCWAEMRYPVKPGTGPATEG